MRLTLLRAILYTFFSIIHCWGQQNVSPVSVSYSLLKKHVYLLASDSLQGRATGTKGQLQAAFYCSATFRRNHLATVFPIDSTRRSFRQTYPFTITEVANFGSAGAYRVTSPAYKRYELAPLPLTAKDSSHVLFGDNVAGALIGTDLKQEVVIVSAHYDHLGRNGSRIFHGADDNASGTATVLSVAAVFDSLSQRGIKPRRTIMFVLFSGEEGGLLGSEYFVRNSPIPLSQFVCDLNVDMVGRVDNAHRKNPDYCYLLRGDQVNELQKIAEVANQQSVNLTLNQDGYDTKNDPERYFYRSDHYNFARIGIPALFFTNGSHNDYHQPSDTADKINYEVLQKRATLLFQTAWLAASPAP
ncbi:M28 family peptidase [Spirosoma fluviale]|uniref:Peptidase family M28 n=1 Tax=Spirosoma fluviale TaxID=1597977 RepID=A0A286G8J3_9BACT|nr:M28 family peptidase [Spirosoma fluviale]SOD91863.1 Peptidase family M28 [Spirosoma fluviale]